jgi:hypothetical protein
MGNGWKKNENFQDSMIILIKIIHTVIWAIMAAASFYILYAGIFGIFDMTLVFSIALLIMETVVLFINRWTCPLTPMAKRYTADRQDNFDIYLPLFLAKYNKILFGAIFITGSFLVLWNWIEKAM